MKRIASLAALAAAATVAACTYPEEPRYIGHGASAPYGTPETPPPLSYRSSYYAPEYTAPTPETAPTYATPAACYQPAHYDRWGYWVPARYVC